jgi:RHS repeat-associated protein
MPSYDTTPGSKPKAYLNWILLDNQFNYVSGNNQSGAIPVGSPNILNTLATTIKLKHSGYLYIWVSNETQNWQVFFDNLSVQDFSGPMLEETHYYPFGLTMAGISDKALKTSYAENKFRYNKGSELQNKEFSDGLGLEMYDTKLRELDPQLGRWWQIDSKTDDNHESESPYRAMDDDPVMYNDPNGDEGETCCKAIWDNIKQFGSDLATTFNNDLTLINQYVNPLTPAVELATGKSFESGFTEDKSRLKSVTEVGISLIPLGKVVGVVEKVGVKVIENVGERAAGKTAEKTAETMVDNASSKARFIVEKDGLTVDTKATPKGSYQQPDGGRTDVLQNRPHYNKTTGENVGQSHTHAPYSNTHPTTGETRTGASHTNAHRPTPAEVNNIETGKAKKIK